MQPAVSVVCGDGDGRDGLESMRCTAKNRERLLNEGIAEGTLWVLERARKPYMSDEQATVDGTLIEAGQVIRVSGPKTGPGTPPGAGRRYRLSRGKAKEPDP